MARPLRHGAVMTHYLIFSLTIFHDPNLQEGVVRRDPLKKPPRELLYRFEAFIWYAGKIVLAHRLEKTEITQP